MRLVAPPAPNARHRVTSALRRVNFQTEPQTNARSGPYAVLDIRGGACTEETSVACHIRVTGSTGHGGARQHSRRPAGHVAPDQRHCPAPDSTARHGLLD